MAIQKIRKEPQPLPHPQLPSWTITSIFCSDIYFSSSFCTGTDKKEKADSTCLGNRLEGGQKKTDASKHQDRGPTKNPPWKYKEAPERSVYTSPRHSRYSMANLFLNLVGFCLDSQKYTECGNQPDWKSVYHIIILQRQSSKGKRNFFCVFSGDFRCLYPI